IRKSVRKMFFKHGVLLSRAAKEEDSVYRMYYDFREPVSRIAKHRVLAVNRGEREGFLQVKIEVPEELIIEYLLSRTVRKKRSVTAVSVEKAVEDSFKRLIAPSVENEEGASSRLNESSTAFSTNSAVT